MAASSHAATSSMAFEVIAVQPVVVVPGPRRMWRKMHEPPRGTAASLRAATTPDLYNSTRKHIASWQAFNQIEEGAMR